MGGGDLNLKKSWHPSTLRNIERVWKAEQKHVAEQQRIEQLQKELADERARQEIQTFAEDQGVVRRRNERLDWMYQGPCAMVDREEYLLGRKVDKTLDVLNNQEKGTEKKEEDEDGMSVFSSQNLSGTATVDLANKIREDPLFNIMKTEKEQRKQLLSNPVKMKQLQQLLQSSLGKKSSKSKKHSKSDEKKHRKKHKKEKRLKHSSSDSEDGKKSRNKRSTDLSSKEQKDKDEYREQRKHNFREDQPFNFSRGRDLKLDVDKLSSPRHSYDEGYSRKSSAQRNGDGDYHKDSHRKAESDSQRKRKLDAEERERRLREMQENARWRDQQRERNTKRYREEDEKESRACKLEASEFIKPMLSKAAEKGTLENRVKQRIFSIQRGSGVMDKHFARRS